MAQHDYDIANGTGAAVRTDINNALAAILTLNSGATEPTTRQAYMLWADTTAGQLKQRNAANNAWVVIGTLGSVNWGLISGTGATQANALGSASSPSYAFSNDTNTGAFSPGADVYAIATAGAERVRINSVGAIRGSIAGASFITNPVDGVNELASNVSGIEVLRLYASSASYSAPAVLVINTNRNTTNGSYDVIEYFNLAAGNTRFSVNDAGTVLSVGSYNLTTASAANVFIDAAGVLQRSTSSGDYKSDVRPVTDDEANVVLELNPIRYRSLAENDNKDWSWYGLIAEDVAAQDPRLVHWGYREEDYEVITTEEQRYNEETEEVEVVEKNERRLKEGVSPRPEGVQYERVGVLTLAMVQRMQARLVELEARIAALES